MLSYCPLHKLILNLNVYKYLRYFIKTARGCSRDLSPAGSQSHTSRPLASSTSSRTSTSPLVILVRSCFPFRLSLVSLSCPVASPQQRKKVILSSVTGSFLAHSVLVPSLAQLKMFAIKPEVFCAIELFPRELFLVPSLCVHR